MDQILAIADAIKTVIEYGQWIRDRVEDYREADKVYQDLIHVGLSVCEEQFKAQMHIAQDLCEKAGNPEIQAALHALLTKLVYALARTKEYLTEHNPNKSLLRQWDWSLSKLSGAKELLSGLDQLQNSLSQFISTLNIKDQRQNVATLLTEEIFKLHHGTGKSSNGFRTAKADLHGISINVLLERVRSVQTVAKQLQGRFDSRSFQMGILPCLGHIEPSKGEPKLIFQLPQNGLPSTTLQAYIAEQMQKKISLETRFHLAHQLCNAVVAVHAANLLHKSIRSENILVIRPDKSLMQTDPGATSITKINGNCGTEGDEMSGQSSVGSNLQGKSDRSGETSKKSKTSMFGRLRSLSATRKSKNNKNNNRRSHSADGADKSQARDKKRSGSRNRRRDSFTNLFKARDDTTDTQVSNPNQETRGRASTRPQDEPTGEKCNSPPDLNADVPSLPEGFGGLYLTYWNLVRPRQHFTSSGLLQRYSSERRGTMDEEWYKRISRHPDRGLKKPKVRYNTGHDIYSLGVCLLEIGLWEILIWKGPLHQVSDLFIEMLDKHPSLKDPEAGATEEQRKVALEERQKHLQEELKKASDSPEKLKKYLVCIAKKELPSKMGQAYTNLVVGCLTCLDREESMGWGVDFSEEENLEAILKFQNIVQSFFTKVSVGI